MMRLQYIIRMGGSVKAVSEAGMEGIVIDVECHMSNGLPGTVIVGLGNKAIDESKERLRAAFAHTAAQLPKKRITLNLAPADVPKDGSSFDLAMAAAILLTSAQIKPAKLMNTLVIGELGLDGSIRPVRGIIGKLLAGKSKGIDRAYIPIDNLKQAQLVPDMIIIPVSTLGDFYLDQTDTVILNEYHTTSDQFTEIPEESYPLDISEVVGQHRAKRALEIAAAGSHNIFMNGPPGTGKSMLAKCLPSILPPLHISEILEVTHLNSLANRQYDTVSAIRPFRSPHHSASQISIIGGGSTPRPGEISLSHRGVLFFDELPEYARQTIEALRQPLEDRVITVARAKDTLIFPADFMFVATANPCPCGYLGSSKSCSCTAYDIMKYQKKLSGPIMDRIDLYITVDEVQHAKLLNESQGETSSVIRDRIVAARMKQQKRYKDPMLVNANLSTKQIKSVVKLSPDAKDILDTAAERLNISARSYMRILKVARTIADLDDSLDVTTPHITEALQYRRPTHTF